MAVLLAAGVSATDAASCLPPNTGFEISLGGFCTYEAVLTAYEEQIFSHEVNVGDNCANTAAQDLAALLGVASEADAPAAVVALCEAGQDAGPKTAFHKASKQGPDDEDMDFERLYYNGGSDWNEQVQTIEMRDKVVMEYGFCEDSNGRNQNKGLVVLNDAGTYSAANYNDCYELCVEYGKTNPITACEVQASTGTCSAHTQNVAQGSSPGEDNGFACWVMGDERFILKEDANLVKRFYEDEAEHTQVNFPSMLTNFDTATCEAHAAMCCWPKDRQAGDGNGNCNEVEDQNCVDRDPADNTDLCLMRHPDGNLSTKFDSANGVSVFPDDNDRGEGPIHCHGFAWADYDHDYTSRYKGNNLFFVSMYDHMHQRGYVGAVPGAPMCACIEQMPVVSRSDCTQIDVEESYSLSYDGTGAAGMAVSLDDIVVDFNSCRGIDNRNNDLWAYMGRLYYEGKVSGKQWKILGDHIVGNNNCQKANTFHMAADQGYIRGYQHDASKWVKATGRGDLMDEQEEGHFGPEAFKEMWDPVGNGLLLRKCIECRNTHKTIVYKRVTPLPAAGSTFPASLGIEEFYKPDDLLTMITHYRSSIVPPGHEYGTDFKIYSSVEDALADKNEWGCENYKYGQTFPGDCDPDGNDNAGNQEATWPYYWGGQRHAAFYFEKDPAATFDEPSAALDIGGPFLGGKTVVKDSKIYMTAGGNDIWSTSDQFHFYPEEVEGDFDVTVDVTSLFKRDSWTKAGLLIRSSLDADSVYFGVVLSGINDVIAQWRMETASWSSSRLCTDEGCAYGSERPTASLKLTKRYNYFRAYHSRDGGETWLLIESRMMENLSGPLQVGLGLTSHNHHKVAEAVFENYAVETHTWPTAAPTLEPAVEEVATTTADLFSPCTGCMGNTTMQGKHIRINAMSWDTWGSTDSLQYYMKDATPVMGDFDAVAHVSKMNATAHWAKTGIMVRNSLDRKSQNCFMGLPEGHDPVFQWREVYGEGSFSKGIKAYWTYNDEYWLKLEKRAGVCRGYSSRFGEVWDLIWEQPITFEQGASEGVYVGLSLSSNNKQLATAEYDHFSVSSV